MTRNALRTLKADYWMTHTAGFLKILALKNGTRIQEALSYGLKAILARARLCFSAVSSTNCRS
jgi:hypothetical protein